MRVLIVLGGLFVLYATAMAQDPASERKLAEARLLREQGAYDKAMEICRSLSAAKDIDPSVRAESLYQLAQCQLQGGDEAESVKTLGRIFQEYPQEAAVQMKVLRDLEMARRILFLRAANNKPAVTAADNRRLARAELHRRLERTVLDLFVCRDVTFEEALRLLEAAAAKTDPVGGGFSFQLVRLPAPVKAARTADPDDAFGFEESDDDSGDEAANPRPGPGEKAKFSTEMKRMSVETILRSLCECAGMRFEVLDSGIVVLPAGLTAEPLVLRIYPIDPRLLFFGDDDDDGVLDFQRYFEEKGVSFPAATNGERASIIYDRGVSKLVVRNTQDNLDLISTILRELCQTIPQVKVQVEYLAAELPEKLKRQLKITPSQAMLAALPAEHRRTLGKMSLTVLSAKESYVQNYGQIKAGEGGALRYYQHMLTATPQVATDGRTISLEFHWRYRELAEKGWELYLNEEAETQEFDKAFPIAHELRSEVSIFDGSSSVIQIAEANPEKGQLDQFLVITTVILDPDERPTRKEHDLEDEAVRTLLRSE